MKSKTMVVLCILMNAISTPCWTAGRLEGKVAIITGAVCGIGKAHAELFAEEGVTVIITTSRKLEQGRSLASSINSEGGSAIFRELDVRHEEDWNAVISETLETFGSVDVLVNNAWISLAQTIENTSLSEWNEVIDVNATGVFLGTKYAIEAMKDSGRLCSIINISSIDALIGEAMLPAYCASKGAITSLTKSVAMSCAEAKYPIRVNSVHPGYIHTELTEKEAYDSGLTVEEYLKKVSGMHPIGHIGTPLDVAYVSLFLASDESKWITGAEFVVDGGYTAQ